VFDNNKKPLVMGVINVTPDSFSGDGVMAQGDHAKAAGELANRMIAEGADILDIGGESSRPGAAAISAEEEKRRVVPVIAAIRKIAPSLPLAVDTVKAEVAAAALDAGATIINDISALAADADMAKLVAKRGTYVVLMHNRSNAGAVAYDAKIGGQYEAPGYANIVEDVAADLERRIAAARAAGIAANKIIADPGLGFGKTVEQNCALINRLDRLKARLKCPILIGPSRKSFIGHALDQPVEGRLEGTAATVAIGVLRGADIVRVHDVGFMARVAAMAQILADSGP
jgi:dihydropteroate synthase